MKKYRISNRIFEVVFNIAKTWSAIICVLLITSCTTTLKSISSSNSNSISIFVDFDELGIDKESFIVKFGPPTNKEMFFDDKKDLIEVLYYTELLNLDRIAVTTKFRFINNILNEQKMETIQTQPLQCIMMV